MKTIGEAVEEGTWEIYLLTDTGEKIFPNDPIYPSELEEFTKIHSANKYKAYLLVARNKSPYSIMDSAAVS